MVGMDPANPTPEPQSIRFSLRRMMIVLTLLAVCLGLGIQQLDRIKAANDERAKAERKLKMQWEIHSTRQEIIDWLTHPSEVPQLRAKVKQLEAEYMAEYPEANLGH